MVKIESLALLGLAALFLLRKKSAAQAAPASDESALSFPIINVGGEPGISVIGREGPASFQIVSQGILKDPWGREYQTKYPLIYISGDVWASVEQIAGLVPGRPTVVNAVWGDVYKGAYAEAVAYAPGLF